MKKLILSILLVPCFGFAQIDHYFELEDFFTQEIHDVLLYAKYKQKQCERLCENEKSTSVYIYYRGQKDAYDDMVEYVKQKKL